MCKFCWRIIIFIFHILLFVDVIHKSIGFFFYFLNLSKSTSLLLYIFRIANIVPSKPIFWCHSCSCCYTKMYIKLSLKQQKFDAAINIVQKDIVHLECIIHKVQEDEYSISFHRIKHPIRFNYNIDGS